MKILSVASEIFPLIKTGGLADVAGALPIALAAQGAAIRSLVPGYPAVVQALRHAEPVVEFHDLFGGRARVLAAAASSLDLLVLDAPHLYARPGNPYVGPDGHDWADNGLRFAALARVAADIGLGLFPGFVPDAVHAHDWQAALAPAYLHYDGRRRAGTLVTIHNMAFQGVFPSDMLLALGLPPASFTLNGVEYYGNIGYLKAGLQFADRITTVSPTYAVEICTPEGGRGLDGLLRARVLCGILNGIDETVWNPATDRHIVSNYDRARVEERAANKPALQETVGLVADPSLLLFGMVGRMTSQKGLDLVFEALPALLDQGGQLVLLGSGDARLEQMFLGAAAAYPGRVAVRLGYDERVAHWIQAGSDALLVPSRFEPCGLTQLCALRYGAVPVVARVGGLADTIIDANEAALQAGVATGIQFAPVTAHMLRAAIIRTAGLWRAPDVWKQIQRNAMATEVGWRRSAARYIELYRQVAGA